MLADALHLALTRLRSARRIWLIYYFAGLLFAAAAALPARSLINSFAGHSLLAAELTSRINMDLLIELLRYRGEAVKPLMLLALLLGFFFWLLLLFLSGGALKLAASDHPYRPREFWDACGRYFGRFLRWFLWTLPLLAALLLILPLLTGAIQRLIWGPDPAQNISFWFGLVKMAARAVGLLLWALFFDYGRILAIIKNEKKTRRLLLPTLRFVAAHFLPIFSLALLLTVISFLALGLYNLTASWLGSSSSLIIALLFLWQQAYMLFRAALRFFTLAAQMKLVQMIQKT